MGKINLLDMSIANKIAAGEVVERPASVVKELVENSIDADASIVTVEIEGGGVSLIRITDNGIGMSPEDANTAFLRHATSKIKSEEDLGAIMSLGFRGEALSSIAAVAVVTLTTREKGIDTGYSLKLESGEITASGEAGCPEGTVIEIRDIFYNTPARRKFLKSDRTEAGYIAEIMEKIALAYPQITFKFIADGKVRMQTYGDGQLKTVVYNVYGKEFAESAAPVDMQSGNIYVTGLAGLPSLSRGNRRMQNFYVNGRLVKSPMLTAAAEEAYKNRIMIGRFPFFVINITLPADRVDVNVHPAKTEVKFADSRSVYTAVYSAVASAVSVGGPVQVHAPSKSGDLPDIKAPELIPVEGHAQINRIEKPVFEMKSRAETEKIIREIHDVFMNDKEDKVEAKESDRDTGFNHEPSPAVSDHVKAEPDKTISERIMELDRPPLSYNARKTDLNFSAPYGTGKSPQGNESEPVISSPEYRIIGQLFDTYILIERDGGFVMIDQHAAHERQKYEELKTLQINSQIMLIPAIVKLTPVEFRTVMDNDTLFEELGFELDDFGNNSVAVRRTPVSLDADLIKDIICEIAENIITGKQQVRAEIQDRAIYTIACKSAIKANRNMSLAEMEKLADWVFSLKDINTCPHGRPVSIELTKYEIEKMFKRA